MSQGHTSGLIVLLQKGQRTAPSGIMAPPENEVTIIEQQPLTLLEQEVSARSNQRRFYMSIQTRPYFSRQAQPGGVQRFRQILDGRLAPNNGEVRLPDTKGVDIIDRATQRSDPVLPNLRGGFRLLIALGVLLDLTGLLMPGADQAGRLRAGAGVMACRDGYGECHLKRRFEWWVSNACEAPSLAVLVDCLYTGPGTGEGAVDERQGFSSGAGISLAISPNWGR